MGDSLVVCTATMGADSRLRGRDVSKLRLPLPTPSPVDARNVLHGYLNEALLLIQQVKLLPQTEQSCSGSGGGGTEFTHSMHTNHTTCERVSQEEEMVLVSA